MSFEEILFLAKHGDEKAMEIIIEMYRPLMIKYSIVNGIFDEDLFQELMLETVRAIRYFQPME